MSPLYDVVRISKHRVRCPNQDIAYQISKSRAHTLYLSIFLHGQNFWRMKFTPKNANFLREICKKSDPQLLAEAGRLRHRQSTYIKRG